MYLLSEWAGKMKVKVFGNIPVYARDGDAGADLVADETVRVGAGQRVIVSTGTYFELPKGLVALVHPRSGLALKYGITVLNAPGTIDSGYRGEVKVILYNTSNKDFVVKPGDRIAQVVFQKYEHVTFQPVAKLSESERGDAGFGSTGRK